MALPVENPTPIGSSDDLTKEKLSPIQKAGMKLAIGVGSVITLVIIIVLVQTFVLMVQPKADTVGELQTNAAKALEQNAPALASANVEERQRAEEAIKFAQNSVKEAIGTYTTMHDSTWNRTTTLFDLIVVKALLPIFTTILGYIFGTRVAGGEK